jgi:cytochrome c
MSPFKPLFLAGCTILGLATQPADALDPRAQRGLALARTNCTKCHAIGKVGDSPMREAPPFRTLHKRYPVEDLAEALAEGISTGHPSMPEWRFDPGQIGDLIEYLKTLE